MNQADQNNLHNQQDVKPGSALEKLVNNELEGQAPVTNGTGANNAVPRTDSLIIKDENQEAAQSDDDDN